MDYNESDSNYTRNTEGQIQPPNPGKIKPKLRRAFGNEPARAPGVRLIILECGHVIFRKAGRDSRKRYHCHYCLEKILIHLSWAMRDLTEIRGKLNQANETAKGDIYQVFGKVKPEVDPEKAAQAAPADGEPIRGVTKSMLRRTLKNEPSLASGVRKIILECGHVIFQKAGRDTRKRYRCYYCLEGMLPHEAPAIREAITNIRNHQYKVSEVSSKLERIRSELIELLNTWDTEEMRSAMPYSDELENFLKICSVRAFNLRFPCRDPHLAAVLSRHAAKPQTE